MAPRPPSRQPRACRAESVRGARLVRFPPCREQQADHPDREERRARGLANLGDLARAIRIVGTAVAAPDEWPVEWLREEGEILEAPAQTAPVPRALGEVPRGRARQLARTQRIDASVRKID